jgi:hypothetical protein
MAPRRWSRYTYSVGFLDQKGALLLTEPEPFTYRSLADNVIKTVENRDTLWGLAFQFFQPLPRPSGLWWVIADFQPVPIVDPTIALVVGSTIHIPSVRTVEQLIFSASRQQSVT